MNKPWRDLNFHEDQGESISKVLKRNMGALKSILVSIEDEWIDKNLNIGMGTQGTALSSVLHYYNPTFDEEAYFRSMDLTPYRLFRF